MLETATNSDDKRTRRPEKTYSKHVMLTEQGREQIETWARANELNFSAAIETLALLGLADPRSAFVIPALRATTLQGIRLTFKRLARLLADIALEAAVARTTSEGVLLQLVREAAVRHPDDFEQLLLVRRDRPSPVDARIRRFHDNVKTQIEGEAVRRLQGTLSRADALFDGEEEEDA